MPYALLPQGESLYYQVIGQGAPLILVHGNLCAGAHFAPFLPYLPKGIACYIPDLRGAGKSSYHTPLHSIDDLSEDLYALLRHLGLGPVILVGWSAGGPVCMSLALKHPDLVRAICLVESVGVAGCPLFTPQGGSYRSAKEMAQEPTQVAPALSLIRTQDSEGMAALWQRAIFVHQKPSPAQARQLAHVSLQQRSVADLYWALARFNLSAFSNGYTPGLLQPPSLSMPVLVTWAEDDGIISYEEARQTAQQLSHRDPIILPHCGRAPFWDCPDRLAVHLQSLIGLVS